MIKSIYIFFLLLFAVPAFSQTVKRDFKKDSVRNIKFKSGGVNKPLSLQQEIKTGLQNILDKYTKSPNEAATWAKIKLEAENFLYPYFKSGKLMGTTVEQAYYVHIGAQTMTATDIAESRKIMIAGVAEIKPAEFSVIRIESR